MKKEAGFILPLTSLFVSMLLLFIAHNVMVSFSQISFYNEVKNSYYLDNLRSMGVEEVKEHLKDATSFPQKWIWHYERGSVEVQAIDKGVYIEVNVLCKIGTHQRNSKYRYNRDNQQLYIE